MYLGSGGSENTGRVMVGRSDGNSMPKSIMKYSIPVAEFPEEEAAEHRIKVHHFVYIKLDFTKAIVRLEISNALR